LSPTPLRLAAALTAAGLVTSVLAAPADSAEHGNGHHVLLVSVDGLHQSDLAWYTRTHPGSALAALVGGSTEYTHAKTPFPSDSFPGMVAQATGGNPATTGIYYDSTYNHALLPAGTVSCQGKTPGAAVDLTEDLDKNKNSIDAGQGLPGLPGGILAMTGEPQTLLDPAKLPVDPKTCKPVYPHQYLPVNTIFEVAHQAGLVTAWSDKHPAYDILNGPSGTGISDLFTPEINSAVPGAAAGSDWTTDNASTRQYDGYKTQAVLNEIDGYDHSRTTKPGIPGIFGLNLQSVSTAQKLPTSDGQLGGYRADGTPGPLLTSALDFVDRQLGAFTSELKKQHHAGDTTIILSAKHGQSPIDPAALNRIDDGPLIDGLNAAWKKTHPAAPDLVALSTDDDGMLLWLSDRSPQATGFAKSFLLAQSGSGDNAAGAPTTFTKSGLRAVYSGADAARYIHVTPGDARVPDVIGIAQPGVVYTGGMKKIAEHGGAAPDDRDVPLIVSGTDGEHHVVRDAVETTQIAPTILVALGLNPKALQAVQTEHTAVLPHSRGRD
jgi:hypothetical protein